MPPPQPPPLSSASFLAPSSYDDDASSIHSAGERSDQDTDSEDDNVLMGARTSADIREHDRSVLLEEEERDRLLEESRRRKGRRGSGLAEAVSGNLKKIFRSKSWERERQREGSGQEGMRLKDFDEKGREVGKGSNDKRRQRRRERRRNKNGRLLEKAANGEDGELLNELEEGGLKEGSSTGESSETESSDVDRRGLLGLREDKSKRRRKWLRWCFIHLIIAVGFSILVLLAWRISRNRRVEALSQPMRSNGTALFAPTTILISLDGFRADFLQRGITPRLNAFVKEGVSPIYMNPSFPSVTFPNHYTLVTGLYPESHGVVGNTFWDEDLQEEFYYTHPDAMQPKWWGGEPLWVTAEYQGIRTAIHMWPGSEAGIAGVEPAFLDKYNGKELLSNKVSRILELLDRPGQENKLAEVVDMRPQLIAAYVPNVDGDGHRYGPNSTEIRVTIESVDTMLEHLFRGLEARNLTDIVNVVVVSDHGMATTDINRLIQLEDLIDMSLIEHTDGWPLYGLRPTNPGQLQHLYETLAAESAKNPNFEVYLRDRNMPERYHFSRNERIAPLWVIPKTGWAIVTKDEFDVEEGKKKGLVYSPKGLHGYDHEHPLMRAIFIARGPAFPHAPNSRVEPFQNIEVYNIICDSLGLSPKPNNGTLRLPLKTIGLHTPETTLSTPPDPDHPEHENATPASSSPPSSSTASEPANVISISPIEASTAADPNHKPPAAVGVDVPTEINVDRPKVSDGATTGMDKDKGFLKWLEDQVEKMKGWIHGVVGGGSSSSSSGEGEDGEKKKGDGTSSRRRSGRS